MSRDFGIFMPKHLAGQWRVNSNFHTIYKIKRILTIYCHTFYNVLFHKITERSLCWKVISCRIHILKTLKIQQEYLCGQSYSRRVFFELMVSLFPLSKWKYMSFCLWYMDCLCTFFKTFYGIHGHICKSSSSLLSGHIWIWFIV